MLRLIGTVGLSVVMLLSSTACTVNAQDVSPAPGQVVTPVGVTVWPLRLDTPQGQLAIYQPQPETFAGNTLTARAAVSLMQPGATDPVFGAMWMQAHVGTDQDARTVTILDTQVKKVRFPQSTDDQQAQFASVIEQQIPRMAVTFSLDDLNSTLQVAQQEKANVAQLQTAPPKILYSNVPSTLVMIDGPPQLQPIDQTNVMRVVNTPFILLLDMGSKQYFLKAGDGWFVARDATGPFQPAGNAPGNVADAASKLAAPAPANADPSAPPTPPELQPRQILVATEPTELISTNGAPTYTPLPGNDLLYVSNTLSDVFMDIGTQQTYVLLAGRWYSTRSLQQGPWTYVAADQLPPSFANIPADSPKAHCLASVAGTQAAADARMDAAIPQTAAISRTAPTAFDIAYDGAPKFESIQETPVSYAVNTPESVLLVQNHYYLCHQAVWYDSGTAVGPWAVCSSVPAAIYTIPPSCPVYNCRYVYVYDSTPDVVYCGYLPGYCGSFVFGPTVVFGTGYFYPGWYGNAYYARPWTYGCGVRYDPVVRVWGFGASYGWDRRWMAQDRIDRDHGTFGPRGYVNYRTLPRGGNRTVINNVTVNNTYVRNIYSRTQNVQRNVTINRGNVRNDARPAYSPPRAGSTYENNVFAGHDGQVYRRTDTGWEQRSAKGWNKMDSVPEAKAVDRANTGRDNAAAARDRQTAARDDAAAARDRQTAARDSAAAGRANDAAQQAQRQAQQRDAQAAAADRRGNSGLEADYTARQRAAQQRNQANADRNAGDRRDISAPPAKDAGGRDSGGRDGNNRGKQN